MVDVLPRFQPVRVWMGLGAVALMGTAALRPARTPEPEAAMMPAVYARPAEAVEVRSLGAGQTLGEVLAQYLAPGEQNELLLAFREQASPRRMRVGTEIILRYRGEEGWLRGLDVALTPDETVRLTRDEVGWRSERVETPTWTDTLYTSGTIEDVLWNAVVDHPALAELPVRDRALLIHHLDQVFQWQVDFSRQIQRGDYYRFAFERRVRPDGSMRAGHIIAAELVNQGTSYHAVWFDAAADGRGAYYDMEGKSVRRAFLLKPLEFRRISSRYTTSRLHPILKTWRAHRGVDYAADRGTPIMTTADGVVTHRGPKGGLGNAVIIRHPNGWTTRYGHLSGFEPGLRVGTRVRQGDVVGYVGMTGLATAPHLHYELMKDGRHVDPLGVKLPAGDPVPDDARARWSEELARRTALLERLPIPSEVRYAQRAASTVTAEDGGGQER